MARKKYPPHPGVIEREDGSIAVFSKRCTKCRITKNLDEFSPNASMRDGRNSRCCPCDAERTREARARRRAEGLCEWAGCPEPAAEGRGGRCAAHADADAARQRARYAADPEAVRESDRAYRARLAARTDAEVARDLAAVLGESEDGLLKCRAGHHAPAENFSTDRSRRSGKRDYCCLHDAERKRTHETGRNLPSWAERDLWVCAFCGGPFEEIEHTVARTTPDGPGDIPRNTAPSCANCNRGQGGKWTTPVEDWLDALARAGDPRGVRREVWADWPRQYLDVTEDGTVYDVETGEVIEAAAA